jgi:hypothetical protein
MPPHPPNGIGDGGQLDAREDLSLRSATHTTSSLVPEGKQPLRSAWPDVARGTSTCPLRPLQVPASCRRGYSSELPLHDRGPSRMWKKWNFRCREVVARTDNSRGANRRRDLASSRRTRNRRGTTAGHLWSEREPVRQKPASTCSLAAPGVGLEPTTYGLTVRRGHNPATREDMLIPACDQGKRLLSPTAGYGRFRGVSRIPCGLLRSQTPGGAWAPANVPEAPEDASR